jgi:hypothetical protein
MENFFLIYIFIGVFFCFLIFIVWYHGRIARRIKRNGIKARGVIIKNHESTKRPFSNTSRGLGGNLNYPVIRFTIEDGSEVTGKPVTGFVSQHEVQVPSYINIIYDPKEPTKFIIDPD